MRASIAGQKVARRLDRRRRLGERRQPRLPGADRLVEVGLAQPPRGQRRALARVERAEREFGGGEIVVGRDRHDARQSLNCARLRCSQVLIVGTGRPKRLASASRLEAAVIGEQHDRALLLVERPEGSRGAPQAPPTVPAPRADRPRRRPARSSRANPRANLGERAGPRRARDCGRWSPSRRAESPWRDRSRRPFPRSARRPPEAPRRRRRLGVGYATTTP